MRKMQALDLGPRLSVMSPCKSGTRARELRKDPSVQQLVRGVWVRWKGELSPLQRAVLLRDHLEPRNGDLYVTGLNALELLALPVGHTDRWVNEMLGHPESSGRSALGALARTAHLAWSGQRCRTVHEGIVTTKALGLPTTTGAWQCPVTHPVESLVVSAASLSLWRITACLDAILTHDIVVGARTALYAPAPEALGVLLDQLPARSRRVALVRQALSLASFPVLSPMETLLRLLLLRHGAPPPVTNHEVRVDRTCYYLDLAWPEAMVALEYNGDVHYTDRVAYGDEGYRIQRIREAGWDVRPVVWEDFKIPHRRQELLAWVLQRVGTMR